MCLFCFSSERLNQDEMKGKYGEQFQGYANNTNTYDITMCQAPCKEPCCMCKTMTCYCCAQVHMRHKALNHVQPESGWDNYKCCQGYFGGCLCIQPGSLGESTCPVPCMCLESCLFPGMAVSATSQIIRERYSLGLDEDDIRLIRCNNCLQCLAICASCLNICIDFEGDDLVVGIINLVADVTFCCVSGCMTAQVNREIEIREGMASPKKEAMQR